MGSSKSRDLGKSFTINKLLISLIGSLDSNLAICSISSTLQPGSSLGKIQGRMFLWPRAQKGLYVSGLKSYGAKRSSLAWSMNLSGASSSVDKVSRLVLKSLSGDGGSRWSSATEYRRSGVIGPSVVGTGSRLSSIGWSKLGLYSMVSCSGISPCRGKSILCSLTLHGLISCTVVEMACL